MRLKLFELVNGKRDALQLAKLARRHINNVRRDLNAIRNAGLIQDAVDTNAGPLRRTGVPVYEKVPLARTVPSRYFLSPPSRLGPPNSPSTPVSSRTSALRPRRPKPLSPPTETEILDICKHGEDQVYEFKAAGTEARKITREAAAMINTRQGGMVFYGIDDDGTIQGSDLRRQDFDQRLQNSVKNCISPAATVGVKSVGVIGAEVLVVIVPPWNRKDVYQFDEKVLIRKGTNVFAAKPEELRKLHRGIFVI
jgi:hypothetical protein